MPYQIGRAPGPGSEPPVCFLRSLGLVLLSARVLASYAIEIAWWKELGQFRTWLSLLYYSMAPLTAATLLAFATLW